MSLLSYSIFQPISPLFFDLAGILHLHERKRNPAKLKQQVSKSPSYFTFTIVEFIFIGISLVSMFFSSHRSTENWLLSAICHIAIFGKSVWQYLKNEVSWSLFSLFMPSTRLLTWIFHSPFSQKHWELISCDIPHLPYSANPYFKTKQWGNRLTFSLWNVSWTSLLTVYPCFMTVFTIFSVPITESFGKCLPCSKKFFHPFTQKTRKKRKGGVLGEP